MSRCRLVVADDEVVVRAILRDFVEFYMPDFEIVGEAANGRDAVRLAERVDPDVILMDVRMPIMDGIQATCRIKRELGLRAVVITITSFPWSEIKESAMQAGARLHLRKPFDLDELRDVLRQAGHDAGRRVHAAVV